MAAKAVGVLSSSSWCSSQGHGQAVTVAEAMCTHGYRDQLQVPVEQQGPGAVTNVAVGDRAGNKGQDHLAYGAAWLWWPWLWPCCPLPRHVHRNGGWGQGLGLSMRAQPWRGQVQVGLVVQASDKTQGLIGSTSSGKCAYWRPVTGVRPAQLTGPVLGMHTAVGGRLALGA